MTLRFDLHLHSHYSYDCLVPLEQVVSAARRAGLDGIALTDHNEIAGSLRLASSLADDDLRIIPAEEITTAEGDLIGLFLSEWIPPGLSARETVQRIKAQGGLVYVPHPLARGVPPRLRWSALWELLPDVDIIEGFNARSPFTADNQRAQTFALAHGKAIGAGSDAHFPFEYGRCWVEIEDFDSPQQFLENLRRGRAFGPRRTAYWLSGLSLMIKRVRLTWWRLQGRHRFQW
jgi:predicted metal-dependent phosphoesterase TrpH